MAGPHTFPSGHKGLSVGKEHIPCRFLSGWLQSKEQHKARCFLSLSHCKTNEKAEFPPKTTRDTCPPISIRDHSTANHIIPYWGAQARNRNLFCQITAYCQNPPKAFSLSKNPRDNSVKTFVHKYLCK